MTHKEICKVKCLCEKSMLKKRNVISVGVGFKFKDGRKTPEKCIVVGVVNKIPLNNLAPSDLIPVEVNNIKTDVVQLGEIKALGDEDIDPTDVLRPMRPGISIAHHAVSAGTFGIVVKKAGVPMILSNNHVLANSNNAKIGDDIIQPGPFDGGTEVVAKLEDFVPIKFEGDNSNPPGESNCPISKFFVKLINKVLSLFQRTTRIQAVTSRGIVNTIDAAIAKPFVTMTDNIIRIGTPTGSAEVKLGETVKKYGRTTKLLESEVLQVNATVNVNYGGGKVAILEDQIITGYMSEGGDSGSAVLNTNNAIVGLLFAGSSTSTIHNRIQNVFQGLEVTL